VRKKKKEKRTKPASTEKRIMQQEKSRKELTFHVFLNVSTLP
jgi:hypothetical protein